jgi:hypothetical protein
MICIPKLALEIRDILLLALLLSPRLDDKASEEYILEGKIFKLQNKLLEVVLENYGE